MQSFLPLIHSTFSLLTTPYLDQLSLSSLSIYFSAALLPSTLPMPWPFQVSIRPALRSHYHSTSNTHWHFLTHRRAESRGTALPPSIALSLHLTFTFLSCVASAFFSPSILVSLNIPTHGRLFNVRFSPHFIRFIPPRWTLNWCTS